MPLNDAAATSVSAPAKRLSYAGGEAGLQRALPVEAPVGIIYSPKPYAVMMATPADLEDFAFGFSLTEGVISDAADIRDVRVTSHPDGHRVEISLVAEKLKMQMARTRNLAGRTGCGVCGIEDIEALPFAAKRVRGGDALKLSSVRNAVQALDTHLPLGDLTRATHAAAWCSAEGDIVCVREDVGRHNALDKLIGALLRAKANAASGFVLVTSRCSFEMVEKAAAFGASAIVAISAPTSLALERALLHSMTLVAVARRDGALLFSSGPGFNNDLLIKGAQSA